MILSTTIKKFRHFLSFYNPLLICFIITFLFFFDGCDVIKKCENVVLTFEVVDNFNQPVKNKTIIIENLSEDILREKTDDEGLVQLPAKLCKKEQSIIISITTKDFPNYSKEIVVSRDDPKQKFQIRLGIKKSVQLTINVTKPKEASYKLYDASNKKYGEGVGKNTFDVLPNSQYTLDVESADPKYQSEEFKILIEDKSLVKNIELKVGRKTTDPTPPEKVKLKINIKPNSGRWEIQGVNFELEGKNDKTISLFKGSYIIKGFSTKVQNLETEQKIKILDNQTLVLDVRPKKNSGTLNINISPESASWQIIDLASQKTYKKGKGSSLINQVPLGKYEIKGSYGSTTKRSRILVLTNTNFSLSSTLDLEECKDLVAKCDNSECIIKAYRNCIDLEKEIQCSIYSKVANAYDDEGYDDLSFQVFEKGYKSTDCLLKENKNYLYSYFIKLSVGKRSIEANEKGKDILEFARAETDYQLEGSVLAYMFVNTYGIINNKIQENRRDESVCTLFNDADEYLSRINTLNNILDYPLRDVSQYESAMKGLKFSAIQCQ